MKIAIARKSLLERFDIAASFAPKRSSKEVLTNVHLEAVDGELKMFATDTETGISVSVPCEVLEPGQALAPRDRLLAILNESQCETVELYSDDESFRVVCGTAKFKLQSGNPAEFPRAQLSEAEVTTTIKFDDIHQAVSKTTFATDPDSSRFALGGALFAFRPDGVDVVGTDGRRLSTVALPCAGRLERNFIVPAKSLQLLCRAKCSGDVTISSWNNSIVVCDDDIKFFAREVEGRYPNWQNVIPKTEEYTAIEVETKAITSLFRQAAITQDAETRGVDLVFDDGIITASCSAQDIGRSQTECKSSPMLDPSTLPISMKIDSRFMLEFLKSVHGDESITVYVKNSTSPMLLVAGTHRYVIMPMASN